MTSDEQVQAFADDLDKLVERYRHEFELNFACVVGILHAKAWFLIREAESRRDELG